MRRFVEEVTGRIRPRVRTRVVLFFLMASAIALVVAMGTRDAIRFRFSQIAVAEGRVVRTDCPSHQAVFYRFDWEGREVTGSSDLSPSLCGSMQPGDPVVVWLSEDRPELNSLEDPKTSGAVAGPVEAGLFMSGFISLVFYLRSRWR